MIGSKNNNNSDKQGFFVNIIRRIKRPKKFKDDNNMYVPLYYNINTGEIVVFERVDENQLFV
jgi:hypothetical protein